ncbi:uncharacterized protein RCO7_06382 [Rhynchosporium graminicola]|uniref:Uncharacterized protein n=1 Tax=Rhynchosporium graminicola TaxID=2792576 RepID=A0A1E1KP22_9HELO|nr:uncharacterized protein RCO7_06382 [Rhynchosporium commune]
MALTIAQNCSLSRAATDHSTVPLKFRNLNQIPIVPLNLKTYISTSENFEKITIGIQTGGNDMAEMLKLWDIHWKKVARS